MAARNRLEAFIKARSEWCISRQRSWGVPIPILHDESGAPLYDSDTVDYVIEALDNHGTDHWWTGPIEDFIPPSRIGRNLTRAAHTLDVWFDSGSSWTMRDGDADVYLEGSDQHRGWFQSSLLTRIGTGHTTAPYTHLITHGFITDEKGSKMSKSAGNGLSPMDIIHGSKVSCDRNGAEMQGKPGHGADVLRLWAASVDYFGDASIGPNTIAHADEMLRKLRNVTRFLLAAGGETIVPLDKVELSLVR